LVFATSIALSITLYEVPRWTTTTQVVGPRPKVNRHQYCNEDLGLSLPESNQVRR
jgi:hypothetical protein